MVQTLCTNDQTANEDYPYSYYSVVWVTVGLLPLWHDLKIHIISSYHILDLLTQQAIVVNRTHRSHAYLVRNLNLWELFVMSPWCSHFRYDHDFRCLCCTREERAVAHRL